MLLKKYAKPTKPRRTNPASLVFSYPCMCGFTVPNLGCRFLVTLMLVHVSSKKMCLYRHLTCHLKAHRISNNMVLKSHAQEVKEKKVGTITKIVTTFSGFHI